MIEDHDFSVYEGKTELEIISILKPHENRSGIADILVDLGLLSLNPFSSRKLKATWSFTTEQDLIFTNGIDLIEKIVEDLNA